MKYVFYWQTIEEAQPVTPDKSELSNLYFCPQKFELYKHLCSICNLCHPFNNLNPEPLATLIAEEISYGEDALNDGSADKQATPADCRSWLPDGKI